MGPPSSSTHVCSHSKNNSCCLLSWLLPCALPLPSWNSYGFERLDLLNTKSFRYSRRASNKAEWTLVGTHGHLYVYGWLRIRVSAFSEAKCKDASRNGVVETARRKRRHARGSCQPVLTQPWAANINNNPCEYLNCSLREYLSWQVQVCGCGGFQKLEALLESPM